MSLMKRFADFQPPHSKHRRYSKSDSDDDDMGFFSHPSSSAPLLSAPPPPSRKQNQASARPRDDVDDFLSSDLELSFASTVSLNSPHPESSALSPECEPMDISPVPFCKIIARPRNEGDHPAKPSIRPRAYTSAARTFGNNLSNDAITSAQPPASQKLQVKRTQRAALPSEWFLFSKPKDVTKENEPQTPLRTPDSSGDAMDVDSEASAISKQFYPPVPHSASPTAKDLNTLFHDNLSPRLSLDSSPDPQPKKRRSVSPHVIHAADDSILSSPAPPSSPSQQKLERISSGPVFTRFTKPTLQGLGNPQTAALKKPRRLALSVVMQPSEASPNQCASANAILSSSGLSKGGNDPPTRRAFSALLPPTGFVPIEQLSDESSFDGPDMSSPAQAYSKRQSIKTLRRCDGTDDFRPLTGAAAIAQTDHHYESPRSKYLAPGLSGFGDNEAHGKILPCHRVKEDGLMRIRCETVDDLLDGVFDPHITNFLIIDCRFDYEYDGGHILGAINVKNPAALEELLLGADVAKPPPCMSGDGAKKTIIVFHCEFSSKRAPTFAKQFRSRDRAMNNHVYPNIHFPEVYILEGGYCQYFKQSSSRCEPPGYVPMDDPRFVVSRNEDMVQFRKAKFGRYKSYTYGDGPFKALSSQLPQPKRNSAPTSGPVPLFAAANAARTRRSGLSSLPEDGNLTAHSDNEDTDVGDSPCPPPTKVAPFKAKKLGRGPLTRAETFGPTKMAY